MHRLSEHPGRGDEGGWTDFGASDTVGTHHARRTDGMRFGIHLGNQHLPGESAVERFQEHIEQVRLLRDYGFDSIWAGQHYLAYPLQYFQTIPLMARLAAEAGPMWLGSDIIVLTVQNPVDMAE